MKRLIASHFDSNQHLADEILTYLHTEGGVIVTDLLKNVRDISLMKEKLCDFCKLLGDVSSHNNASTAVWDILASETQSQFSTFSEHTNEAELHTDSQYREKPEDHFALYCIQKANCSGGLSLFLSVEDIINELNENSKGRHALQFFANNVFPYVVPDVFKINPQGPPEYTFGHLLKDGKMRFRIDSVQKAMRLDASLFSSEHFSYFNFLSDIVLNSKKTKSTQLEKNECLFINNKTMLHGRTEFKDKKRHLLRVRFYDKSNIDILSHDPVAC